MLEPYWNFFIALAVAGVLLAILRFTQRLTGNVTAFRHQLAFVIACNVALFGVLACLAPARAEGLSSRGREQALDG